MKHIQIAILLTLLGCSVYGQSLETILRFNSDEVRRAYIPAIDSLIDESAIITHNERFDRSKYNANPLISILFMNLKDSLDDVSIYNRIVVDSCIVYSMAYVDDKSKLMYIASFDWGLSDIRYFERNKKILKRILACNPDAILYCRSFSNYLIPGLLYVKNNTLYYFDKKSIKISDFFRNFSEHQLSELNYVPVPNIYRIKNNSPHFRKTDEIIPKNENIINIVKK